MLGWQFQKAVDLRRSILASSTPRPIVRAQNERGAADALPADSRTARGRVVVEGTDVKTGLVRHPTTTEDYEVVANTRFLLCATPALAQPAPETKTVVVWCAASCTSTPTHDVGRGMTEVVETLWTMRAEPRPSLASQPACGSRPRSCSALARPASRVPFVFEAMVAMSSDVIVAASAVAQIDKRRRRRRYDVAWQPRAPCAVEGRCGVLEPHALNFVPMPGVTPSNVFSIGLHLLEAARAAWGGIAPKQSPLAVPLAPQTVVDSPEYYEVKPLLHKNRPCCSLTC